MLFRKTKLPSKFSSHALQENAFETEMKLVDLFEVMVGHRLSAHSRMLREFECVDGVADIILFELYKNYQSNLKLGQVQPRWAYTLRELPYRKCFTTDQFIASTGVSRRRALEALIAYVKLGYCRKGAKPHTWFKIRQPTQIVKNIFAIEAKLKDWKRALAQAIRYRDYANQAWVLMDKKFIQIAIQNLDCFKEADVGLASIDATGFVAIYFHPQYSLPKLDIRFWQANAEIARRLLLAY